MFFHYMNELLPKKKNREKILDKYHNLGGKEKAKEYYQNNKDILE